MRVSLAIELEAIWTALIKKETLCQRHKKELGLKTRISIP